MSDTTEQFPGKGHYLPGSVGHTRAMLEDAKELLREIRDGLVNPQDEADKFLRDHAPSLLQSVQRDLAAAEAKLAAKPDVARLVKEATTEALHQDARALTWADQSIAGALLRRLADALLSQAAQLATTIKNEQNCWERRQEDAQRVIAAEAQLAEKEAENVKLRGAVPCCQDFDNCTQRCFPRAEHFKAECEGLNREVFQLGTWLIRVRQQMFPAHDQKAIIHKEFPRFAALDSARARKP